MNDLRYKRNLYTTVTENTCNRLQVLADDVGLSSFVYPLLSSKYVTAKINREFEVIAGLEVLNFSAKCYQNQSL